MKKDKLEVFYIDHHKKLLLIPIILLLLAAFVLFAQYQETGDFINKDVTLRGGLTATVYTDQIIDIQDLDNSIDARSRVRNLGDVSTGRNLGYIVEVSGYPEEDLELFLESYFNIQLSEKNYSVEETGPSLGESFYKELLIALLFAFALMAIVVFFTFRSFIPSLAIVFAAFADIVITLAIVNLMGMEMSTAGIVAFLLVLGYSIDTDILLTTRVLKKNQGSVFDRMLGSMKTGLTMSCTTLSAIGIGYIFSTSLVLKQMFLIIFIALVIDILTTYLTNTGMLYWYCKVKNIK